MPKVNCSVCGKEFAGNAALERHESKKNPCKAPTQLINTAIENTLVEVGVPHLVIPTEEFRESSKSFHTSITKENRQEQGIFFTPKKVREILFQELANLKVQPKVILEPSFGSGEFLLDARRIYPNASVIGVEKNVELFKSVKCPGSQLNCGDFLTWKGNADLIIGNPPYFVMDTSFLTAKGKKEFQEENKVMMTGRPNIYIKFLYKCLEEHLEKDGYLAFVIPTSLYNCSYYQPMRNYIQNNMTIRCLKNLDKPGFFDTTQDTMLIIIQKCKMNDDYIYRSKNNNIYISPFYKELKVITKGTKTIKDLNLGVKTGNVVWNQVKSHLKDKGTLLIYSSNITNNELKLNNLGSKKKQYVEGLEKPTLDGPVILVERGYGNCYRFNYVLVKNKGFYAENHINVIYPLNDQAEKNLEKVIKSFQDERTENFLQWFQGNGSLSSTELETTLPIFDS